MHPSSYNIMAALTKKYLDPRYELQIVDIGSYDVNGSYRPIFDMPVWHYLGVDLEAGKNVDLVMSSPYKIDLPDQNSDVIISGQAFEHIEFFWLTWMEIVRILKPGGYVFLIAPSRGPEHKYPVDCWRFYPDGFRALAKLGGLNILDVNTSWDPQNMWGDTYGAFRKPAAAG